MEKLSEKIATWIITNDPDSRDKYEIFVYTLQCLFGNVMANGALLILGAILGKPLEAVSWILFYNALRLHIGGSHAKTFARCFLGGTIYGVLCIAIIPYLDTYTVLLALAAIISVITTFWVAPVIHPNRLMSESQISKKHRLGKQIVFVECVLILVFYLCFPPWLAHSAALGMFSAALLCIIGKLQQKSVAHSES
ncbi:MAG: accessory gene regulator B family protein [Eubacteriales bacterium]|nr:accessory gene regulator B family protein [Eubacteriales bacterium]